MAKSEAGKVSLCVFTVPEKSGTAQKWGTMLESLANTLQVGGAVQSATNGSSASGNDNKATKGLLHATDPGTHAAFSYFLLIQANALASNLLF